MPARDVAGALMLMCGIAGAFSYGSEASPISVGEMLSVREAMASRGPDGEGLWVSPDQRTCFVHRRLSIIDLSSAGDQPMQSSDGSLVIVFNGEIYNFSDLRRDLQRGGYQFRSSSDTEVLLALYERFGEGMLEHLRGMYSFVIWDSRRRQLFGARDPFGIKPLYLADDGKVMRFASQVRALRNCSGISTEPDPAGHVGFFLFGFVPEPYSLFRSVRSLPAGHWFRVEEGGSLVVQEYFDVGRELSEQRSSEAMGPEERRRAISEALRDSVDHHLVSDVPVSLFLSAGIDSACIASLAASASAETLQAHTLGFGEFRGTSQDETIPASRIARELKLRQSNDWVSRSDFESDFENLMHRMDQPTIDGVNTYFISKIAAASGTKVALSGLGGDELFAGYHSFRHVPLSVKAFAWSRPIPAIARGVRAVTAPMIRRLTSPKYAGLLEYGGRYEGAYLLRRGLFMPWELPDVLDPDLVREGWAELQPLLRLRESMSSCTNDFQRVAGMELSWYMKCQLLRDADWAGMAHSLEIRVPFVDKEVLRAVGQLSASGSGPTKRELAQSCLGDLSRPLISRGKTGFSIPVEAWAREIGLIESGERPSRAWAKAVYRHQFPRSARHSKERVLVFRVGNLGDTLVSLPAVHRIRRKHENANLALLSSTFDRLGMVSPLEVIRPTAWFDDLFTYRTGGGAIRALRERMALIRRLRRYQPTVAYNLAPRRNTWQRLRDRIIFRYLLGVDEVHETDHSQKRPATGGIDMPTLEPEWRRLYRVVESVQATKFDLPIPREYLEEASKAINGRGGSRWSKLIAFGPGSKMSAKMWPVERFAELGERILAADPDCGLLILGGKEDRKIAKALASRWGDRAIDLVGEMSIFGSAAVLKMARLFVGNDTGTMHLAAMVGTQCVAIFSARDFPGLWEPYGEGHTVIRKSIECGGCMLETCVERHNECLDRISVEEVFSRVSDALAKEATRPTSPEAETVSPP